MKSGNPVSESRKATRGKHHFPIQRVAAMATDSNRCPCAKQPAGPVQLHFFTSPFLTVSRNTVQRSITIVSTNLPSGWG
jgi:hypothetical protein